MGDKDQKSLWTLVPPLCYFEGLQEWCQIARSEEAALKFMQTSI